MTGSIFGGLFLCIGVIICSIVIYFKCIFRDEGAEPAELEVVPAPEGYSPYPPGEGELSYT